MGATLSPDLVVQLPPHMRFDIINCAHQHLKRHVEDIAVHALSYSVREARTMFRQCGDIDVAMYHRCFKKLDVALKPTLLRLHVQAHWSDAQQDRYYLTQREGVCPHCKVKTTSILHLWECRELRAFRRSIDEELADTSPDNVPHHFLMGIPEVFDAGLTGDFCTGAVNGKLGDLYLHGACLYDEDRLSSNERLIRSYVSDDRRINHQQLAYKFLATTGKTTAPCINLISGTAPAKPNVASDGGLKHSGRGYAYGTFGTWEPGREWPMLTPEELAFARPVTFYCVPRPSGIMLAGIVPGVYNSSSRAELGGVISGLAKPVPVHIALDNKAVADRASAIVTGTFTTCRHVGFRCGSQSLHKHNGKNNHVSHTMQFALRAQRRKQAKLRAIGSLGEPKRHQVSRFNSVGHLPNRRTMVHQQKNKEARGAPDPKVG